MSGSVGSCPHHGSWPVVLPDGSRPYTSERKEVETS